MSNGGIRKWVAVLVGFALMAISVWLYMRFIQHYRESVTRMNVWMPTRFIQAGEVIRDDMVQRVTVPELFHHRDAATSPDEIVGRAALAPIGVGEEFLLWKLGDPDLAPGPGRHYFSFKTDKLQNISNMVRKGDRVDVWLEFESPKVLTDAAGHKTVAGGVKLIERLLVAGVKSAEGTEVSDSPSPGMEGLMDSVRGPAEANRTGMERARSRPNGVPELNTFLMSDEEYNAFVLGTLTGTIKLSLSSLQPVDESERTSRLTEMYRQLQAADAFHKEEQKEPVRIERLVPEQVTDVSGGSSSPNEKKSKEGES